MALNGKVVPHLASVRNARTLKSTEADGDLHAAHKERRSLLACFSVRCVSLS